MHLYHGAVRRWRQLVTLIEPQFKLIVVWVVQFRRLPGSDDMGCELQFPNY